MKIAVYLFLFYRHQHPRWFKYMYIVHTSPNHYYGGINNNNFRIIFATPKSDLFFRRY